MEIQKFTPEGWNEKQEKFDIEQLQFAKSNGTIIEGFVESCDENCNLKVNLGENIEGTIPRNEMDIVSSDEFGLTRSSICKNKVGQFVQFKVKEIYDENHLLLSRKEAEKEVLNWVKNELEEGSVVDRNCQEYAQVWCFC